MTTQTHTHTHTHPIAHSILVTDGLSLQHLLIGVLGEYMVALPQESEHQQTFSEEETL